MTEEKMMQESREAARHMMAELRTLNSQFPKENGEMVPPLFNDDALEIMFTVYFLHFFSEQRNNNAPVRD